jgi:hypothetical protein
MCSNAQYVTRSAIRAPSFSEIPISTVERVRAVRHGSSPQRSRALRLTLRAPSLVSDSVHLGPQRTYTSKTHHMPGTKRGQAPPPFAPDPSRPLTRANPYSMQLVPTRPSVPFADGGNGIPHSGAHCRPQHVLEHAKPGAQSLSDVHSGCVQSSSPSKHLVFPVAV